MGKGNVVIAALLLLAVCSKGTADTIYTDYNTWSAAVTAPIHAFQGTPTFVPIEGGTYPMGEVSLTFLQNHDAPRATISTTGWGDHIHPLGTILYTEVEFDRPITAFSANLSLLNGPAPGLIYADLVIEFGEGASATRHTFDEGGFIGWAGDAPIQRMRFKSFGNGDAAEYHVSNVQYAALPVVPLPLGVWGGLVLTGACSLTKLVGRKGEG